MTAILAFVKAIFAARATVAGNRLRVIFWGAVLTAGSLAAIHWPTRGVVVLVAAVFWWAAEARLANWRLRNAAGLSAGASRQSASDQNRLLALLLVLAPVTAISLLFGFAWPALVGALSCAAMFVLAGTEATPETRRAVEDTLFVRAIRKLRFPRKFLRTTDDEEFSGVALLLPATLFVAAFGIVFPPVAAAPEVALQSTVAYGRGLLSSPDRRGSQKPRGHRATRDPGRSTPPQTSSAAVPCDDSKTKRELTRIGLSKAISVQLIAAQHQFGPPTVGCNVSSVDFLAGGDSYVIFEGGETREIVIGDAHSAAASINTGADLLIQRVLDPTEKPQVARTFTSARAGTGVFQLVEMSNRSCRLLLSPDGGDRTFFLTAGQTRSVVRRGRRLVAFPMASSDSAQNGTVIQYIAIDPTSPNGFGSIARDVIPFREPHDRGTTGQPGGCDSLNEGLALLAEPLEQAAEAAVKH